MDTSSLEYKIGEALKAKGLTLASAESCSGGLVSHRITNVAGASAYFPGGIAVYSNDAKVAFLAVSEETLREHGAVSEEVAGQMALGVRNAFDADLGISCTGIAGPTGETPGKPVGLVYIGFSHSDKTVVTHCQFTGDREQIKEQTAEQALAIVWEYLK